MADVTLHVSATREAIRDVIARIPQELTGDGVTARAMMTRIGMTILSRVRQAFITKARGGTDDAGDRWAPLSPQTIRARRRAATGRGRRVVKGSGDLYGNRPVEILRDTGLLLNSLSPGTSNPHQLFEVGPGSVTMGTNRAGAAAHHSGVPGRLPQRRLWPDPKDWPQTWWQDITEQAMAGLLDITVEAVRQARD